LIAAVRVFVFSAASPFFNNVNERPHVDLAVKYSHAKPPRGIEPFAPEAAAYFIVYSTPEYLFAFPFSGRQIFALGLGHSPQFFSAHRFIHASRCAAQ